MRIVRDGLPPAVALTLPNAAIFAVTGVGCRRLSPATDVGNTFSPSSTALCAMAPPAAAADPVATLFAPQQIPWLIFSILYGGCSLLL
jgi:hypothetical protein